MFELLRIGNIFHSCYGTKVNIYLVFQKGMSLYTSGRLQTPNLDLGQPDSPQYYRSIIKKHSYMALYPSANIETSWNLSSIQASVTFLSDVAG